MMRSANPALRDNIWENERSGNGVMTIQGTVNKTMLMLGCVVFTAMLTWSNAPSNLSFVLPAAIVGLILAMVTIFKRTWAPVTAPLYALVEGVIVGGISMVFEKMYPGIVMQAVALTFGTLFSLLVAYKTRLIKVTENLKLGIVAATGGICLVYFVSIIIGFFGVRVPIFGNGLLGIGFSVFVVVIAALNLVMDFDFIEKGAQQGAPKYMEWYGAFGLTVTLIWLYLEILRLLAKLQSRR